MADRRPARLYPLFLKLKGKQVLVVGAGRVAERKVEALNAAGAAVRIVAPVATPRVRGLARRGKVDWVARRFRPADVRGAWLVIAASDDAATQARVRAATEARNIFVVAVDDPANASAYSAAVVERAPFTVAISSSGETPALTRLLREVIERVLPSRKWIARAKALRAQWIATGKPMSDRFADLVRELANERKPRAGRPRVQR